MSWHVIRNCASKTLKTFRASLDKRFNILDIVDICGRIHTPLHFLLTSIIWSIFMQWGSVTHQMAAPVPSISWCVLNHYNLFYYIQNALDCNRDTCCHLALCLQLLPFHWVFSMNKWQKGPVEYWFIKMRNTVFTHKCKAWLKLNEIMVSAHLRVLIGGKP